MTGCSGFRQEPEILQDAGIGDPGELPVPLLIGELHIVQEQVSERHQGKHLSGRRKPCRLDRRA